MLNRRDFLKILGVTSTAAFIGPKFAWALNENTPDDPILVVVFLRGAMDGLSFLPPVDDPQYRTLRPNIAIDAPTAKLKDGFGLHPALEKMREIFSNGEATFLFEAGSPALTRSHFDAQDWMESGILNAGSTDTGFLGRASRDLPKAALSTVAVQGGLPRILKGAANGLAFSDFKSLKLQGPLTKQNLQSGLASEETIDPAILKLYVNSRDLLFRGAAQSLVEGTSILQKAEQIFENEKGDLPKGNLAKNLAEISAMVRARVGLRIAVTEMGGWDTHVNQGNAEKGSLKDRLGELDAAVGNFWKSIGNDKDKVCLVLMTEFGRTAAENGDRGTDHGHGSVFTILNGKLKPQTIHHQFSSLAKSDLNEGRDLNVRFDYRQVFYEILKSHNGLNIDPATVFPQFEPGAAFGLFNV